MSDKIITRLQIQQKNKERVNVFLNDEYAFSLELMMATGLRKGQKLTEADIAALQATDEGKRAYAAALNFLGQRARSQAEVAQRLQQHEFSDEAIEQTMTRLQADGYLNDVSFGQQWVANRQLFRPRSERALRYELRRKGIDSTQINEVLETVEIDEDAAAWAALEPKIARWAALERAQFIQKAGGFLARRGFGHGVARSVLDRAWAQINRATDDPETEDENEDL